MRACEQCGAPYKTTSGNSKTCSWACNVARKKRRSREELSPKNEARLLIFDRDGGTCYICLEEQDRDEWFSWALDHVRPFYSLGMAVPSNLALLCRPCNTRKKHHLDKLTPVAIARVTDRTARPVEEWNETHSTAMKAWDDSRRRRQELVTAGPLAVLAKRYKNPFTLEAVTFRGMFSLC